MNRPTLFLTRCAAGCGATGKLTQDEETGQWYCVNCLWRNNCEKAKAGSEIGSHVTTTPRGAPGGGDSSRASKRERKLSARRESDRKTASAPHGRKKGTSGAYTVGGQWTWEGDDGTPTPTALDKGDPNYVPDEEYEEYEDYGAYGGASYRSSGYGADSGTGAGMDSRHTFSYGEENSKAKSRPTLRRSVSFADNCGGFLEQVIHTCTPTSPTKDDIDVGTARMEAHFSDLSPLVLPTSSAPAAGAPAAAAAVAASGSPAVSPAKAPSPLSSSPHQQGPTVGLSVTSRPTFSSTAEQPPLPPSATTPRPGATAEFAQQHQQQGEYRHSLPDFPPLPRLGGAGTQTAGTQTTGTRTGTAAGAGAGAGGGTTPRPGLMAPALPSSGAATPRPGLTSCVVQGHTQAQGVMVNGGSGNSPMDLS